MLAVEYSYAIDRTGKPGELFDSRIGHEKSTRQLPALFPSSLPRVYLW